jgi:hypothetical protein
MVDKKELEKGHVIIKYNRSSDPTLVVGETYPFILDSGFGSHETVAVDLLIEQRHIDNPFELVYDIISKIVSDTKVVIDWLNKDNSRWDHPAIKRLISIFKYDKIYKNNISELKEVREEFCTDIIRDISVISYPKSYYIDPKPYIGGDSILASIVILFSIVNFSTEIKNSFSISSKSISEKSSSAITVFSSAINLSTNPIFFPSFIFY